MRTDYIYCVHYKMFYVFQGKRPPPDTGWISIVRFGIAIFIFSDIVVSCLVSVIYSHSCMPSLSGCSLCKYVRYISNMLYLSKSIVTLVNFRSKLVTLLYNIFYGDLNNYWHKLYPP